jgi:hypothetical protein
MSFNLDYQVCGQAHVLQGLVQGFSRPLHLAPIAFETLVHFEIPAPPGFRVLLCTSFGWGHATLLCKGLYGAE